MPSVQKTYNRPKQNQINDALQISGLPLAFPFILLSFLYSIKKKKNLGAGEIAQSVKHLSREHKYQSSHLQKDTGNAEAGGYLGSPALHASSKPHRWSQNKGTSFQGTIPNIGLWPAHTHTPLHIHKHADIQTHRIKLWGARKMPEVQITCHSYRRCKFGS